MLSDNVAKAVCTHVHVTDLGGTMYIGYSRLFITFFFACMCADSSHVYVYMRACVCMCDVCARGTLIVASLLYFALKSDEFIDTIVLADAWINVHLL